MCCLVRIKTYFWTGEYIYIISSEIPTFIIAGHETTRYIYPSQRYSVIENNKFPTSVTMTWALYALSQNKDAQTRLREEIYNISTENPTMDDLNGMPFMDAVVRETLRLYPAVAGVVREARKDDCIPLSKPFTDKRGFEHNEIR